MTVPAKYSLTEAHFIIVELERKVAELERLLDAASNLMSHPNIETAIRFADERSAELKERVIEAEARVRDLEEAGRQWLMETGPGQHINTAKGRSMMHRLIFQPCPGLDGPLPCSHEKGHTGPCYFYRP